MDKRLFYYTIKPSVVVSSSQLGDIAAAFGGFDQWGTP